MAEKVNVAKLSAAELATLSKRVDTEMKRRGSGETKRVLAKIRELAASVGMSVGDLANKSPSFRSPRRKTRAATSSRTSKRPPKYANPADPSQTWAGTGRQPLWFKDALSSGKSADELRVAANTAKR
ncbi:MAG: H-NS histone family protein [Beggiatoa sp.]|nr:H-NS histone family protein [Beggiatoa sp.]